MAAWIYLVLRFTALPLLVIVCFLIVKTLGQSQATREKIRKLGCQSPPALHQWDPIFGLDIILTQYFENSKIRSRNTVLQGLFSKYGHNFHTKLYGGKQLFTISPANIKAIYSTDFDSWGVGPVRGFVFGPLLGPGLMTEDGALWKHSRAISAPAFAKPQLTDLETFGVHVTRLLSQIPMNNSTIDLQPLFNKLALDSSTEILFGKSVQSLASNPPAGGQHFLNAFNYAQQGVGWRITMPFFNLLTQDKKFWRSCKDCHEFVDSIVNEAIEDCQANSKCVEQNEKNILIHELIKCTSDRADVRRQLLNLFLPAHDAIAIPLTNIFFQLARHPSSYSKLRREILAVPDLALTSIQALKKLAYLQRVIKETFRLYPGVTTNERVALRDTVLPTGGGTSGSAPIYVRKGELITISFHALQRRQDIWGTDAEEWNPERWEGDVAKGISPWTNLSFGGGPRVCPGQELGLAQLAYTIVRIVKECKMIVRRDPVEEFEDMYRVVTVSRNGCLVACQAA